MPTPLDLISKYRLRLDRQSQRDLDRLISVYGRMSRRLKDKVDVLLLQLEREGKVPLNLSRTARFRELVAELNREFDEFASYLGNELENITADAQKQARLDSAALIAAALAAYGLTRTRAGIPASYAMPTTLQARMGRLQQLAPLWADRIRWKLLEGIRLGWGYEKLGNAIVNDLGLTLADALRWARTTQMEAYREASHNTMLENGNIIDGWTWFAQLDDATCEDCRADHGTFHTADESLNDLTAHIWNCRCVELPHVKGDDNPITGESVEVE